MIVGGTSKKRLKKRLKKRQKTPEHATEAWDRDLVDSDEADDFRALIESDKADYLNRKFQEITGSFAQICRALHMSISFFVNSCMAWEDFCNQLDLEGSARHRWSQPLHRQLAGVLVRKGFSKKDWDLSLPRWDGGILVSFSPEVCIEDTNAGPDNLTGEQSNLLTRMKSYLHLLCYS